MAQQLDAETPESRRAARAAGSRRRSRRPSPRAARDPWRTGELVGTNAGGVELHPQPDGSLVAMNITGDTSTYAITLRNRDLDRVTAIRLEAMTDPSVPGGSSRPATGTSC